MPTGSELHVPPRDPPEDGDLDALLDALCDRPEDEGLTLAVHVSRGGRVVGERYGVQPANDFEPERDIEADSTLLSWSMAKSITHAAVGVLVHDGALDVDAPAAEPEWAGSPKASITVLELLEMRSGLRFVEDYVDGDVSHCIEMLFGDSGPSHAAYAAALPLDHEPGTVWNYSSGTSNIVSRLVGDVVTGGDRSDPDGRRAAVDEFLRTRLFEPAGMTTASARFDAAGDFVGSSFVYATAADFARFGELYAFDGVTDRGTGTRILPSGWSAHAAHQVATDPDTGYGYGRHWWSWPEVPGALVCSGYEGQRIVVVPTDDGEDVVLVHLGKTDVSMAPRLDARLRTILRAASR